MIDRRRFMATSTFAAMAAAVPLGARPPDRRALFVFGGWPGHDPHGFRDLMVPIMEQNGYAVTVADHLDVYTEASLLSSLDVIVQQWTMDEISQEQGDGLLNAVRNGVGLAGWHGGLSDSFRAHTDYQFMVGGQFVAHPGGPIDYHVRITDREHPVTAGLSDFEMRSTEQYYLHMDPAVHVLATTTFTDEYEAGIGGVIMPVAWTKMWGRGRVFHHTIGHSVKDFDVPEVLEMTLRGIRWAADGQR